MARFTDRHIMVTGAAQGIGRAVALRLADEGAALTLLDRQDPAAVARQVTDA